MNRSDPRYDWMRQYAEGTASAETTARLEQALREDAAFRKLFLEYLNVDLALSTRAADSKSEPVAKPVWSAMIAHRAAVAWTAAAAVAVVLLVGMVVLWWERDRPDRGARPAAGRMEQFRQFRAELEQKVKDSNILTDEQLAKWKELQAQRFSRSGNAGGARAIPKRTTQPPEEPAPPQQPKPKPETSSAGTDDAGIRSGQVGQQASSHPSSDQRLFSRYRIWCG